MKIENSIQILSFFSFWTNASTLFPRQESLAAQSFTKFPRKSFSILKRFLQFSLLRRRWPPQFPFLNRTELKRRTLDCDWTHRRNAPCVELKKSETNERTKDQGSKNQKKPIDTWDWNEIERKVITVIAQNGGQNDGMTHIWIFQYTRPRCFLYFLGTEDAEDLNGT